MYTRPDRARRILPEIIGIAPLAGIGVLLTWNFFPCLFPARSRNLLGAFPLATIALAYIAYQSARLPARLEITKTIMLAFAFLFRAANHFVPDCRQATLFYDIDITLFVFVVFLVIVGWPTTMPGESFAETFAGACKKRRP